MYANRLLRRHIVITRPLNQVDYLVGQIRAEGGIPLLFPAFSIVGIPSSPEQPLASKLPITLSSEYLWSYDLVIFVSRNAVEYGLQQPIDWSGVRHILAIGPGTQQALLKIMPLVRTTSVMVAPPPYDSEALLTLPILEKPVSAAANQRILLVTGEGGRNLLLTTLRSRGFEVDKFACYRRVKPEWQPCELLAWHHSKQLAAVVITSSEAARNWEGLLGPTGVEFLRETPYFVLHTRIAEVLQEQGFGQTIVTQGGDAGLVQGLIEYFRG